MKEEKKINCWIEIYSFGGGALVGVIGYLLAGFRGSISVVVGMLLAGLIVFSVK